MSWKSELSGGKPFGWRMMCSGSTAPNLSLRDGKPLPTRLGKSSAAKG